MRTRLFANNTNALIFSFLTFSLFAEIHCPRKLAVNLIINALEKIIDFYMKSTSEMNLDGLLGLRVIEGQIMRLLEKNLHPQLSAERLQKIKDSCEEILPLAIATEKKIQRDYFKSMEPLLKMPWILRQDYQNINPSLEGDAIEDWLKYKEDYDWSKSDICISSLLLAKGGDEDSDCQIDPECLAYMTLPRKHGYFLSHQLLYNMIAEQVNCHHVIDAYLKSKSRASDLNHLRTEFCTTIYYDSLTMMKTIHYEVHQDLFMENLFFCGNLGYLDFFSDVWLEMILNWQEDSGCYKARGKLHTRMMVAKMSGQIHYLEETNMEKQTDVNDNHNNKHHAIVKKARRNYLGKRKLLEEMATSDGCLIHKTSVAAGALVSFLHYVNDHPIRNDNHEIMKKIFSELKDITYYLQCWNIVFNAFVLSIIFISLYLFYTKIMKRRPLLLFKLLKV